MSTWTNLLGSGDQRLQHIQ